MFAKIIYGEFMTKERVENTGIISSKSIYLNSFIRIIAKYETGLFNSDSSGGYIKLLFKDQNRLQQRTISISEIDFETNTFTMDFVYHQAGGLASTWANTIQEGHSFQFFGPGPRADIDLSCDEFFILGDTTAFPAIKNQLNNLVPFTNKKIYLFLELFNETCIEYFNNFKAYKNITILSQSNSKDSKSQLLLLQTHKMTDKTKKSLWAAGERLSINEIRQYLKLATNLIFESKYLSSYWQRGKDQESHSLLKREDAVNFS